MSLNLMPTLETEVQPERFRTSHHLLQLAISRNQSLTESVRQFRPVGVKSLGFSFESPRIRNLRSNHSPVPPPGLKPDLLSVFQGKGTGYPEAARPTASMKSLSRDNARFSQPADWSLNATKSQAAAGRRSAIPPGPGGRSERETEKEGACRDPHQCGPLWEVLFVVPKAHTQ